MLNFCRKCSGIRIESYCNAGRNVNRTPVRTASCESLTPFLAGFSIDDSVILL